MADLVVVLAVLRHLMVEVHEVVASAEAALVVALAVAEASVEAPMVVAVASVEALAVVADS